MTKRLRSLFALLVLLGVCFAPAGPTTHAERQPPAARLAAVDDARGLWLEWSYPYNDATTRTYTARGAKIIAVSEFIHEDPEIGDGYYTDWYGEADSVTFDERAFDAVIVIVPTLDVTHCWSLALTSDYMLLRRNWSAIDGCEPLFLPMVN